MKIITIEELSLKVKDIVDNENSVNYWPKINKYLFEYPEAFFSAMDKRYLGKRRLEKIYAVMTYESKDKSDDSIETLVFNYISQILKRNAVYSIGYESLDIDAFVGKLLRKGIKCLIDVREKPISRKTGFSKTSLNQTLMGAGITYLHYKSLGSPSDIRKKLHKTKNWMEFFEKYSKYLEGQKESLVELYEKVQEQTTCLMCYERDYQICHRKIITNELRKRGNIEVQHL